jgi:hypothetical protein
MTCVFFVYSKSEYTLESVSESVRLHDNSSKAHPTVMKFCTQFEDENDWSKPSKIVAKNVIISYANIDLSRFSLIMKKHVNYYTPFDREFHGLQNGT